MSEQPSSDTNGKTTDTTEADFHPPEEKTKLSGAPAAQVGRLKAYLDEHFPNEMEAGAPEPQFAADCAIRLLTMLLARTQNVAGPATQQARCAEEYCNKPFAHQDEHGWINYS